MLSKLLMAGRHYVREMELEDVAALKLCLLALGALMGLAVPKKSRKSSAVLATILFVTTLIPLMYRFFASLVKVRED